MQEAVRATAVYALLSVLETAEQKYDEHTFHVFV